MAKLNLCKQILQFLSYESSIWYQASKTYDVKESNLLFVTTAIKFTPEFRFRSF